MGLEGASPPGGYEDTHQLGFGAQQAVTGLQARGGHLV